jgi:hypothetical protein
VLYSPTPLIIHIRKLTSGLQVTLEINTEPPPLDIPAPSKNIKFQGKVSMNDLADMVQTIASESAPAETASERVVAAETAPARITP